MSPVSPLLVNATDLSEWANRLDSKAHLPDLVRRIVHSSLAKLDRIEFRAGEGVSISGFDGIVSTPSGSTYVPDGISVWELGTNVKIKSKADDDYTKRVTDSEGLDTACCTFVFVTPRRWGGKNKWSTLRRKEGIWRDVRVYDADDLEQWLYLTPNVHLWISERLGKHPHNVRSLEDYWKDWSQGTNPPLTPGFILAGRTSFIGTVEKFLDAPGSTLGLRADSSDEALAVYTASVLCLPEEKQRRYLSRSVIVDEPSAWLRLVTSLTHLVLIPRFEIGPEHNSAIRQGHHVVMPLGLTDMGGEHTVDVPRISVDELQNSLIGEGIPFETAREVATEARHSISAYRRKYGRDIGFVRPKWATPEHAFSLLPFLLCGSWSTSFDGDRSVLSTVGNQAYEELSRIFQRWSNESDPPVRSSDHCCYIASKGDAWQHLIRYITRDDLERFKNEALLVLSAPDPKFDLPQGQRWMASAIGHRPLYSEWLKHGIAETLAIMGACNAAPSGGLSAIHFNAIAEEVVRQLFREAANNWKVWASISDLLPLLAEAAPDVYLSAVERGLDGESPLILQLFADQGDAFLSSSPHTGLLWSLETLSWSPEYLGRSAAILARLACLDPGAQLANRPISSLHEIFCLWLPQTAAEPEHRLIVIDAIRARSPKVAWDLLLGLIPVPYQHTSPTSKPAWRSWPNGVRGSVSLEELGQQVAQIVSRLVSDVDSEGDRWRGLLEILPSIPLGYELIEKKLIELDIESLSVPHQMTIWAQLRKLVSDHRTFADAPWALPSDRVCVLEEVCLRLVPSHPISKYEWLFSYNPEFLEGRPDDPDQRKQLARKARQHALGEVYASMGFAGLKELIHELCSCSQ